MLKEELILFGRTIRNPLLRGLILGSISVLLVGGLVGGLIVTPKLVLALFCLLSVIHLTMRLKGLNGIFFVRGVLINLTDDMFLPIDNQKDFNGRCN